MTQTPRQTLDASNIQNKIIHASIYFPKHAESAKLARKKNGGASPPPFPFFIANPL
jgi:hypothetical protein